MHGKQYCAFGLVSPASCWNQPHPAQCHCFFFFCAPAQACAQTCICPCVHNITLRVTLLQIFHPQVMPDMPDWRCRSRQPTQAQALTCSRTDHIDRVCHTQHLLRSLHMIRIHPHTTSLLDKTSQAHMWGALIIFEIIFVTVFVIVSVITPVIILVIILVLSLFP